ncbi:MAG: CDP-diacylglycerol--serine O-phosphatidyltransferase [Bacteroidales bacterium]|nr:CDP-diacylglycerol--serine O-phosphatidyltransferase [Bacteroidales bacterium]
MNISKSIPNAITCLNLLCGSAGVIFACNSRIDTAFILMLAAAVCDFLDGFAARALKAYSDIGKELDSLADVVSFGLLPSVMLHVIMEEYHFGSSIWCWTPLLIAAFSALRLAKFNLDERQHFSFLGLPTPACAMLCGSLAYYVANTPGSFLAIWCSGDVFIPLLSAAMCALLVCEIPFFSFKLSKGQKSGENRKRLYFGINLLLITAIVIVLSVNWSMTILMGLLIYILMNIVFSLIS